MASATTSYQQPFTDPQAPKVSAPHVHSRFGTLLSRRLPKYTGQFPVGTLDVEYPLDEPQRVGTFKHTKLHSDAPAGIEVETVLFTMFYPCEVGTDQPGVQWFPRFAPTISGFLDMAGKNSAIYRALASFVAFPAVHGLRFPCYLRAKPLLPPTSGGWPTVVFSHGVGCSRLMYTHICGELASRGYIVVAVEHRDGTGPSAMMTTAEGEERQLDFLRWNELDWPDLSPDQQPKDDTTLRHAQLEVRLLELQTTVSVLGKIASGELGRGRERVRLKASRTYEWDWWNGMMDLKEGKIGIAGHSFGGTAALAVADDPRFSPSYLFIMDPAVQRLEPWQGSISCPVLCVNSEEFAKSEDYDRLLRLSKTVEDECHILTIGGTTHPSFSDVFLITPRLVSSLTGLHIPAYEVFQTTLDLADTFLAGGETDERKIKLKQKGRGITNSLGAGDEKLGKGEVVYQTI